MPKGESGTNRWKSISRMRRHALVLCMMTPALALAESATLNFKDADIRALITTVAEITGKNFIVDPRINGRVTVISSQPMEEEEIYQVFLSVLEVNGFATVPAGSAIKIVPDANAKFNDIPTVNDANPGEGDEIITRVIELQNVQGAQLVPILRPLASPQAHMAAFPENNMLIISDRAGNTERLVRLVRSIDRPSTDEVEIIRLENAAAAELVRILTTLEQSTLQTDPTAARTTLIADERTNSILISGDVSSRLRIRATISHLDTPVDTGGGNTHVVYLRYAKAVDLAAVLTGVPTTGRGNGDSSSFASDSALDNGFDSNSFGSSDTTPPVIPGQIPGLSPEGQAVFGSIPGLENRVGRIGGGSGGTRRGGGLAGAVGGQSEEIEVSIQPDEATNSLVITASDAQFASIQSVIRQLDVRRAQVVVEAVIAEVSEVKAAQLGIQYAFTVGDVAGIVGGTGVVGGTDTSPGLPGIAVNRGDLLRSGISLGLFGDGPTDLRALITALVSDAETNILSTPTLVTMDNQEAEIVVGQNVPFVTGSQQSVGGGLANPFTTIQREDIGLKLKIKPQINEGDALTLEIEQEVSSISDDPSASDIITNKRSIKTVVTVDDGKIVVLGGLISNDLSQSVSKVPFLGDIPYLGALFRRKNNSFRKTNLMVFLHPIIVRDQITGARIASSKYNYIRAEQLSRSDAGVFLRPEEQQPVLPPLEEFLAPPPNSEPARQTIIPPATQSAGVTLQNNEPEPEPEYIPGWGPVPRE